VAAITGTDAGEVLTGGSGGDTLTGGGGGDTLTGGGGVDIYVLSGSDSPDAGGLTNLTSLDVITDWTASDRFLVAGANPPGFAALFQGVDDTYEGAYGQALNAF
jgi:Ca2+-binding RTX toxin-like protein